VFIEFHEFFCNAGDSRGIMGKKAALAELGQYIPEIRRWLWKVSGDT
jgi:hypothetical protein